MKNEQSPFNTLFGESLPRLLRAMEEYYSLASPLCADGRSQLLSELSRRIKQCDFLLRNAGAIEERQFSVSIDVLIAAVRNQPDADQRFEASCQQMDAMRLFSESFYWVAHKATAVILAKHPCFQGKRLPKMPAKIAHGGVTNVRNHLIEHPFDYNDTFSLGGMWCGTVLNGGLGKDSNGNEIKDHGLYFNAIEWADTISSILFRASEELRNEAQR